MNPISKKTLPGLLLISAISISSVSCADDDKNIPQVMADNTISQNATDHGSMDRDTMNQGEAAHKEHCYKCHTDEVYTRDNRFVKSMDALRKQVVRCRDSNDVPWFDDDTDAVVQYLNTKYYKF